METENTIMAGCGHPVGCPPELVGFLGTPEECPACRNAGEAATSAVAFAAGLVGVEEMERDAIGREARIGAYLARFPHMKQAVAHAALQRFL